MNPLLMMLHENWGSMDIAKIRKKFLESEQEQKETDQKERPAEEQKRKDKPRKKGTSKSHKREEAPAVKEAPQEEVQTEPEPVHAESRQHEQQAPEAEKQEEEIVEILTFRLLKEEFAFEISHLNEILRLQRITPVPKMPEYVRGITSLRGKIIPVIDLKKKLSLSENSDPHDTKNKILIIKGARGPVGAVVDRVVAVLRIARHDILPPPSHLSDIELKFIDGVAVIDKRFISIINMKEAISIAFEN
jgi:purine-binding chemotaxis protein CheW